MRGEREYIRMKRRRAGTETDGEGKEMERNEG
jgi:hypothetical protein